MLRYAPPSRGDRLSPHKKQSLLSHCRAFKNIMTRLHSRGGKKYGESNQRLCLSISSSIQMALVRLESRSRVPVRKRGRTYVGSVLCFSEAADEMLDFLSFVSERGAMAQEKLF